MAELEQGRDTEPAGVPLVRPCGAGGRRTDTDTNTKVQKQTSMGGRRVAYAAKVESLEKAVVKRQTGRENVPVPAALLAGKLRTKYVRQAADDGSRQTAFSDQQRTYCRRRCLFFRRWG